MEVLRSWKALFSVHYHVLRNWANISAKDNTALLSTYWLIKQERERESELFC